MRCNGCGNEHAYRVRIFGLGLEECDRCGGLGNVHVPDVYFKEPYWDPNLAHPQRPWECKRGVYVESKAHKMRLMREQDLRECGDRVHGARVEDKARLRMAREQGHGPL